MATCSFFFLLLLFPLIYLHGGSNVVAISQNISALLVFGDSTVDPGNNDYVTNAPLMRSDHPPYGRDFIDHKATGRFSNGKLVTDFFISSLGLKNLLPAFLDPMISDQDLITGVSFASAGSGYDDMTASSSNVITISKQLRYFEEYIDRIGKVVGKESGRRIVGDALFLISAGTNDFLWNFNLLPVRRLSYTLDGYQDFLLNTLRSIILEIYNLGGRKFVIAGLPPMGCLPIQRTLGSFLPTGHLPERICTEDTNQDAISFNTKLQSLITSLNRSPPGMTVVYTNTYDPLMDMINNPTKYGFEEATRGCCGTGFVELGNLCNTMSPACPNASKFIFWDAVHPTEKAYQVLADRISADTLLQQFQ